MTVRLLVSILILSGGISTLNGCTALMAAASGPGPVARPTYDHSLSQSLSDIEIEDTANVDIYKADSRFHDSNINITSFYGTILITGQVPANTLKTMADQICQQISGVKHVYNELKVTAPDYYLSQANNGLIATRVRSSLMFNPDIPYHRIKVVVDDGVVYIMGKISHREADTVVTLIKNKQIHDVQKIVLIVDYVNDTTSPITNSTPGPAAHPSPPSPTTTAGS